MSVQQWWPNLEPTTQQWLIDNNGDVLPPEVIAKIVEAGGPPPGDPWWGRNEESEGFLFPDEAIDWIEETANGEDRT